MSVVRIYWLTLALVLAVILVTVFAAWGVMTYTGSPTFCAGCHVMETRYMSWRRSSHGEKATCIQCHSDPGTWGELKAHLNGTRYLYVMLTGEKSGPILKASVESAVCERCHSVDLLPEVLRAHKILHGVHRARGIECTGCHAGLVHGNLHGSQPRAAMRGCVTCHAKESPSLVACQTCHIQPVAGSLSRLNQ